MAPAARHDGDPVPVLEGPGPRTGGGPITAADFRLTLWTDDPALARRADAAGVDRIGVDLERLGKAERQRGLGTWISTHEVDALHGVGEALSRSRLFARTNPVNPETRAEVETLLEAGVGVLMLPMFSTAAEVERFAAIVDGRAEVVLLLERVAAARNIDEILVLDAVTEVHVGINDFALDLGLQNRFLALTHELTDHVAARVNGAGRRFGIGGIGRVGDTDVPLSPDLIYAQYARLGATAALVSRAFLRPDPGAVDLVAEVALARERLAHWFRRPARDLLQSRDQLTAAAAGSPRW